MEVCLKVLKKYCNVWHPGCAKPFDQLVTLRHQCSRLLILEANVENTFSNKLRFSHTFTTVLQHLFLARGLQDEIFRQSRYTKSINGHKPKEVWIGIELNKEALQLVATLDSVQTRNQPGQIWSTPSPAAPVHKKVAKMDPPSPLRIRGSRIPHDLIYTDEFYFFRVLVPFVDPRKVNWTPMPHLRSIKVSIQHYCRPGLPSIVNQRFPFPEEAFKTKYTSMSEDSMDEVTLRVPSDIDVSRMSAEVITADSCIVIAVRRETESNSVDQHQKHSL